MSDKNQDLGVETLLGQIDAGLDVLGRIERHLASFYANEGNAMGRNQVAAVVVADALTRYYTAAETMFFRIARFFENNVGGDRWHAELLDRMRIEVPGIRPSVLSEPNYGALRELMRFRHFSRYYVELDYDWDRLDFLLIKYNQAKAGLAADVKAFCKTLASLHVPLEGA
ncbi:MAG TPA: hypothetical protein DCS43_17555 [Verrucomicrobia bacterium]|nr:hypothetical protein [Verrucomicrobiota bacterium]